MSSLSTLQLTRLYAVAGTENSVAAPSNPACDEHPPEVKAQNGRRWRLVGGIYSCSSDPNADAVERAEMSADGDDDDEHRHHHYARWSADRPRSISLTEAALRGDRWAMRRFSRMLRQRRGRGLASRRTTRASTGPGARRSTSRTHRRMSVRRSARATSRAADGPPGPLFAALHEVIAVNACGLAVRVTHEQPVKHLHAVAAAGEPT